MLPSVRGVGPARRERLAGGVALELVGDDEEATGRCGDLEVLAETPELAMSPDGSRRELIDGVGSARRGRSR